MLRCFSPVGHGAFYLERFERVLDADGNKVTIIYDCGSLPSFRVVESRIEGSLDFGSTIHAVFISHFDGDHVNGLPFLLDHYNVKHLFVPLISQKELSFLRLGCLCGVFFPSATKFFSDFFDHYPYPDFSKSRSKPLIHCVEMYSIDNAVSQDRYSYDLIENNTNRLVRSNTNVFDIILHQATKNNTTANKPDWLYVPFNFKQESRVHALINNLEEEFNCKISLDKLIEIIKQNKSAITTIKKAYKKIEGSINENSMVLYSGPLGEYAQQYGCKPCNIYLPEQCSNCDMFIPQHTVPAGCLYMGDYNAREQKNYDELFEALQKYWDQIGCVQIPHHGAKGSYNPNLTENRSRYYVISAGKEDQHGHPHDVVIHDMLQKDLYPRLVTEERSSEFILKIRPIQNQ